METISPPLHKKSYRSGNVAAGKTPYDDVFAARPKVKVPTLSPRDEDYSEIFEVFHASRGSSIPVLDLPAVGEDEDPDVYFDVRSSGFDYSEVFGSSNGFDFALYEQLFQQSKADNDSSNEVWTPAQSESLSDESDPSGCSEKNQSLSSGDIHQSYDDTKQFNISYHKANPKGKDNILDAMTHVTQLDAIPGYSFIISDTSPSKHVEVESLPVQIERNTDCGGAVTEGKRLRKTVSQPPISDIGLQGCKTEASVLAHNDKSRSPGKAFISVSDVNLRTRPSHLPPPSRPPPLFADRAENSSRLNSKFKASKSYVFERTNAGDSQPYFDVEIDASSSAAASAAAVKDAVERAQEQLSNAKEMMERKKDGLENRTKSHFKKDIGQRGEKNIKFDMLKSSKGDIFSPKYAREGSEIKTFAEENEKKARNMIHVASSATEGKEDIHSKQGKEHMQSQVPHETEGTVAWREATQLYEVVEEKKISEACRSADHSTSSDSGVGETGIATAVELQECQMQTKATSADHECQGNVEKFEVFKGGHEQVKIKAAQGSIWQEEHQEKSKLAQMGDECQHMDKETRGALQPGETNDKANAVDKYENDDIGTQDQLEENEVIFIQKIVGANESYEKVIEIMEAPERKGSGMERTASFDSIENTIKFSADVKQERGKFNEATRQSAKDKLEKEVFENHGNESKHVKTYEMGQNKEKQDEVAECKGKTNQLEEVFEQEESNNRLGVDLKWQECKKEQNFVSEAEKIEKGSKITIEQWQNTEREEKASEEAASEERPNDLSEQDETEKRLKEAWEKKEKWKRSREARESEKRVELLFKEDEIMDRSSEANVWIKEGKGEGFIEHDIVQEQLMRVVSDGILNLNQGNYTTMEEPKIFDGGSGHIHEPSVPVENESLEMEHKTHEREVEVNNEPQEANVNSNLDQNGLQYEGINDKNKDEPLCQIGITDMYNEDGIDQTTGIHIKKTSGTNEMASDIENANISTHTRREARRNFKGIQPDQHAFNQAENEDKFTAPRVVKKSVENERKPGNVLPAKKFTSQNPEVEETNFQKKTRLEEREKERLEKERDLENDFLRKLEEEKEREREREKDRMGVDTATREARERAFADTRERAERAAVERATAEVRQRALAEARERLEKASAEARERLIADKASDARLKAERAAVERATAEARERAIEKAKAEKASYESRDRVERPVTDKFSAYSRNGGFRQCSSSNNLQHQGMGPSRDLKHSHSSVSGGLEGESAQRCKARLERYQRTAERAAKALAEKNMRDLIAHREQIERSRLAESLDADVKRWSSGKEGNLRALLSTLQYILGPNSGWQPIPLTDVITAAAVKKAYRKATLCVHPDKLQQRGASIHQKYICEKVFDLLKEAWNKFNSEER
ncbi:auxilin-like protein 1 isoform X2 [Daucus carota subsp. sativus]|uniref:auxilin-like protein 1 isoform X2 n=1 Tax=Daucus carota subsp. sativus TaxID=79200 RepID=UPI0007EEF8F7|nr:PREDICTED: auxilin-like protein 1 isoform X2 [Daucus carota subsp. sativus]